MQKRDEKREIMRFILPIVLFVSLLGVGGYGLYAQTTKLARPENQIKTDTQETLPLEFSTQDVYDPGPIRVVLPQEVRGLYWTAETARTGRANELLGYMTRTGLNTVVIDLKMDNGEVVLPSTSTLESLAENQIYRIARIPVMRDSAYGYAHPEDTIKHVNGGSWRDGTGALWLDPSKEAVAQNAIELARQAYALGFDEIQFDYVRFASDGALSSMVKTEAEQTRSKEQIMRDFFQKVGQALQREKIPVSFDLFGVAFLSDNEVGIGQHTKDVYPFSDFLSPMVYPSHYWPGHLGFKNPALHPYEVVKDSLDKGATLLEELGVASSTESRPKFRPWIQDFDIGAIYTAERIEEQIRAARDAGASGWILWNARNVYEPAKYD